MDSEGLGMLIVASISSIGLVQLIAWVIVVIKNPGILPSALTITPASSTSREQREQCEKDANGY